MMWGAQGSAFLHPYPSPLSPGPPMPCSGLSLTPRPPLPPVPSVKFLLIDASGSPRAETRWSDPITLHQGNSGRWGALIYRWSNLAPLPLPMGLMGGGEAWKHLPGGGEEQGSGQPPVYIMPQANSPLTHQPPLPSWGKGTRKPGLQGASMSHADRDTTCTRPREAGWGGDLGVSHQLKALNAYCMEP